MALRVTLSLALATLIIACGTAQAVPKGPRVFTPNDVARLQMVSDARIQPSGDHVAYEVQVQRDPIDGKDGSGKPIVGDGRHREALLSRLDHATLCVEEPAALRTDGDATGRTPLQRQIRAKGRK